MKEVKLETNLEKDKDEEDLAYFAKKFEIYMI